MANVTFKGIPCRTNGELPKSGTKAPELNLMGTDMTRKSLRDFPGKKLLSINLSFDTPVCQATARRLSDVSGLTVLAISDDLPFAQKRFCDSAGLKVVPLSTFDSAFAQDYGVKVVEGPVKGFSARALVLIDENGMVLQSQLVPEITNEPAYADVLTANH